MCDLTWQRDLADMIKSRVSRWGDKLELFWWAQGQPKGPYKRKREAGESELFSVRRTQPTFAGFEDGGREP